MIAANFKNILTVCEDDFQLLEVALTQYKPFIVDTVDGHECGLLIFTDGSYLLHVKKEIFYGSVKDMENLPYPHIFLHLIKKALVE